MSVLGSIFGKIFGRHGAPAAAPQSQAAPAPTPGASAPAPAAADTASPEYIEMFLATRASTKGEPLNWQTSIVDLMKTLDLDSSLANRKALARELGYAGDTDDSATMNIWLHKQVIEKLKASGGKIPAELAD